MSRECATSIAWDNVFDSIAGAGGKPTHASLARGLSEWIDDGRLPGGARLPSTRTIAQKLGIGRNTVLFALANLIDNGYLDSKERSGIFVGLNRPVRTDDRAASAPAMGPDWRRRLPWSHLTIPAARLRPEAVQAIFRSGSANSTSGFSRPASGANASVRPPASAKSPDGVATWWTATTSGSSNRSGCIFSRNAASGPVRMKS